jgi:soluble lytic murein transglycosylase-like protein
VRDAEYNVRLGSTYIKGQLDSYDGEAVLALAAYNAGPGRVSSGYARTATRAAAPRSGWSTGSR